MLKVDFANMDSAIRLSKRSSFVVGRLGMGSAIALLAWTIGTRAIAADLSTSTTVETVPTEDPQITDSPESDRPAMDNSVETAQDLPQINLEFGPSDEPPSTADLLLQSLLRVPSRYDVRDDFRNEARRASILDEEDVDPEEPTQPSLWWRRDQLPTRWVTLDEAPLLIDGGYRLIRNWTAFHSQSTDTYIVDVRVDPQYWNRYNYFQQYAILTQLGNAGMSYGYHVRIYNSISLAGVYACDFSRIATPTEDPIDEIAPSDVSRVQCSAVIGPFFDFIDPVFEDDLFNPP